VSPNLREYLRTVVAPNRREPSSRRPKGQSSLSQFSRNSDARACRLKFGDTAGWKARVTLRGPLDIPESYFTLIESQKERMISKILK
jgi:hypothetical protein